MVEHAKYLLSNLLDTLYNCTTNIYGVRKPLKIDYDRKANLYKQSKPHVEPFRFHFELTEYSRRFLRASDLLQNQGAKTSRTLQEFPNLSVSNQISTEIKFFCRNRSRRRNQVEIPQKIPAEEVEIDFQQKSNYFCRKPQKKSIPALEITMDLVE